MAGLKMHYRRIYSAGVKTVLCSADARAGLVVGAVVLVVVSVVLAVEDKFW